MQIVSIGGDKLLEMSKPVFWKKKKRKKKENISKCSLLQILPSLVSVEEKSLIVSPAIAYSDANDSESWAVT